MAIEVGAKVSGKVSGITNFGAFVDLDDNQTGLVHISQISDKYIKDVHDVLAVGDEVTAKVIFTTNGIIISVVTMITSVVVLVVATTTVTNTKTLMTC